MNTNEFIREEDGKIVIPVPAGIRYISEWTDFNLDFFGCQPYIIDKQIPGCGFTEYCLTSNENVILTSPRRILLENKEGQHPGDVFYAKNECDDSYTVDKDLSKPPPKIASLGFGILVEEKKEESDEDKDNHLELTKMEIELMSYLNDRALQRKPAKIIVTYDSFKHVKRFLIKNNFLSHFGIVVDEFQSIFVDSRFKASTEFGFLEELRDLNNPICFVSATPMMDKYLKQLDYFKDLQYFVLNWGIKEPSRVMKPELKVRKTKSINNEIKRIINEYKSGNFAILAHPTKENHSVLSKEAVFYVNSVNNILSVIKSEGLKPEEVNILCSDTTENRNKLKKKLGVKYKIGSVPLKDQPHKMFTFCTRTVYLGADFYSTNARTFILSDANVDSLAVDISLDLPQILGRQRLIENPWKNHAEFFFKNLGSGKEVTEKVFDEFLNSKMSKTENLLGIYNDLTDQGRKDDLADKYKRDIFSSNYRFDYVSINQVYGQSSVPVFNKLVYIAEQRAFEIQQVDYKDRFMVFSILKSKSGVRLDKISEFVDILRNTKPHISKRLQALCESEDFTEDEKKLIAQQTSEKFDKFYNLLGPERCKALGYNTTDIAREIVILTSKDKLRSRLYGIFVVGKRYSNKEINVILKKTYEELELPKFPKTTDLNEFFEVKKVQIFSEDRTSKENGLEILRIKE